jgi:hypothetical protein
MPKIYETDSRVRVHIGNLYRIYDKNPELFKEFRFHDVGREGYTYRMSVKYKGKWITYAWDFSKEQVSWNSKTKTLTVKDRKAYEILKGLKDKGELKGIRLTRRF